MGPEGGDEGGTVVEVGTPEEIAGVGASFTDQYLIQALIEFEKVEYGYNDKTSNRTV